MNDSADIVIVGAGSAGCVLAERLSANPKHRVVLIEAGRGSIKPLHSFPMLTGYYYRRPEDNWSYYTTPQPGLGDRTLFWPRGKRIGGSSIFNGMVCARGNRGDYDQWAQLGNPGWSYDDVLPYFKRNERHEDGGSELHGGSGLLSVTHARASNELFRAFIDAGAQAGYPAVTDFNGPDQYGVGFYDFHIKKGRRSNSAKALLRHASSRPNLRIIDQAQVLRILFEGTRAAAVAYRRNGQEQQIRADAEIVLAAGTVGTPHLLMLSGVGNAQHLSSHGIAPVADLPGVGENLIDHLDAFVRYRSRKPISLVRELRADRLTMNMARAVLAGTGPVAESPIAAGGYFYSRGGLAHPDLQAFFVPIMESGGSVWWPFTPAARRMALAHGYGLRIGPIRPRSRGRLTLASRDPNTAPLIDPGYLSDPYDLDATVAGLRIARRILGQPAFAPYRAEEVGPGPDIESDTQLAGYARATAGTVFHPVGTARMGTDQMAVVDPSLRVHGVEHLRIADASVMPTIPSGNTNAPTMMVAEKASDLIALALRG